MCSYAGKASNISITNTVFAECTKYGIGAFEETD